MNDHALQQTVKDELMENPRVDASQVAVAAEDGYVTLRGTVGSLRQKIEAGRAAWGVSGVYDVKNELEVRILVGELREDAELRASVLQALMLNSTVPSTIDATVEDGIVTLKGHAKWHFERDEAELVASNVRGVRNVISRIVLEPMPVVSNIEQSIAERFKRIAALDANRLTITSHDGTVTLSGTVASLAERDAAIETAWTAPGVIHVDDRLLIAH